MKIRRTLPDGTEMEFELTQAELANAGYENDVYYAHMDLAEYLAYKNIRLTDEQKSEIVDEYLENRLGGEEWKEQLAAAINYVMGE